MCLANLFSCELLLILIISLMNIVVFDVVDIEIADVVEIEIVGNSLTWLTLPFTFY